MADSGAGRANSGGRVQAGCAWKCDGCESSAARGDGGEGVRDHDRERSRSDLTHDANRDDGDWRVGAIILSVFRGIQLMMISRFPFIRVIACAVVLSVVTCVG